MQQLREIEKMLDKVLRRNPPATGRIWTEVGDGLHLKCHGCGVVARAWVGRYTCALPGSAPGVGRTIHRSRPLCAMCATSVQRIENQLPIRGRDPSTPHVMV